MALDLQVNSKMLFDVIANFSIAKESEPDFDNNDSISVSEEKSCFCVSDGVTGSFYSRDWAILLTNNFIENTSLLEISDISQEGDMKLLSKWLNPIQEKWHLSIPWEKFENASEIRKKYFNDGGKATFLGGKVDIINGKKILKIFAVGDSNLFLVRNDTNVLSFPLTNSEEFTSVPNQLFSKERMDPSTQKMSSISGIVKSMTIDIQKDDSIIAATDAVSRWYINTLESDHIETAKNLFSNPWSELFEIKDIKNFKEFVYDKKYLRLMHSDDASLLILKVK